MLHLEDVSVRFGERLAVDDVTLDVFDGEVLSVLGPSGSGKSTLLRAIAGLEVPASGRVEWDGKDLASVPVHRRGFGLMFQDYVLFPHLDVAQNVGFGLETAAMAPAERALRIGEVLELVGLRDFDKRLPTQLSGGEQQRVALARTLAPQPRLLMLDEPLGALDRPLRRTLLDQLEEIFGRLDTPIIYVTHDHEEALAVGDRVAVMRAGQVEAVLPPAELWHRPPTEFVARFLGFSNIVDAELADGHAATPIGTFALPDGEIARAGDGTRRASKLLLRPDAFRPASGPANDSQIEGEVLGATFRGDHTLLVVDVRDTHAGARRVEVESRWSPPPAVGEHVRLTVDPAGVVLLPLT